MGAWENAVNASFVERIGQHLANIQATDGAERDDYVEEFVGDYEMTFGDLPAPQLSDNGPS